MTAMIASIVYCIVGCNTGAPDKQALHVLECDTETGTAKIVQSVKDLQGTTYFQIDKEKKNLYSAIGENGKGAIVKFALEGHTIGAMTKLCDLPCETPCHISLTPDEKRVSFAVYWSGIAGTVGIDGQGLVTHKLPDDAVGPNKKRQQKAFAHQTFFPFANTMGVCDLGCDRLRFFDPETMQEKTEFRLAADPGDGPRHAVLSADGKIMFVINELASTVTSYRLPVSSEVGRDLRARRSLETHIESIGSWSSLPGDFNKWEADGETLATKAAAIKLTADGKILMASNRGYDSIAFYEVGPLGRLKLRNIAKLAGKFPRDFELMPGEKFMVVGHKMSDEIQVYAFDREDCTLTPVGQPIKAWRPLCFKFL